MVEEFTSDLLDRLEGGVPDLVLLALLVAGSNFLSEEVLRERLYLVVPETIAWRNNRPSISSR